MEPKLLVSAPTEDELKAIDEKGYSVDFAIGEFGAIVPKPKVQEVPEEEVAVEVSQPVQPVQQAQPQFPLTLPEPPSQEELDSIEAKGYDYDAVGNTISPRQFTELPSPPNRKELRDLAKKGYAYDSDRQAVYSAGSGNVNVPKDLRLTREDAQKLIWLSKQKRFDAIEEEADVGTIIGSALDAVPEMFMEGVSAASTVFGGGKLPLPPAAQKGVALQKEKLRAPKRRESKYGVSFLEADKNFWGSSPGKPWSDIEVTPEEMRAAAQVYRDNSDLRFDDAVARTEEYDATSRAGKTLRSLFGYGAFLGDPQDVAEATGTTQRLKEASVDRNVAKLLDRFADSDLPNDTEFSLEDMRESLSKGSDEYARQSAAQIASDGLGSKPAADAADMTWGEIGNVVFSGGTVRHAVGAGVDTLVFFPIVAKNVLLDPARAGIEYAWTEMTGEEEEAAQKLDNLAEEALEIVEGPFYAAQGLFELATKGVGGAKNLIAGTPEEREATAKRMALGMHEYAGDVAFLVGGLAQVPKNAAGLKAAQAAKKANQAKGLIATMISGADEAAAPGAVKPSAKIVGEVAEAAPFGDVNAAIRIARQKVDEFILQYPGFDDLPELSKKAVRKQLDVMVREQIKAELYKSAYQRWDRVSSVLDPTSAVLELYGAGANLAMNAVNLDGGRIMRNMFRRQGDVLDQITLENLQESKVLNIFGEEVSALEIIAARDTGLHKEMLDAGKIAERIPDELVTRAEDVLTNYANEMNTELWIERPNGEAAKVQTGSPDFNIQGILGRELTPEEVQAFNSNPMEFQQMVVNALEQKRGQVADILRNSETNTAAKILGLTGDEAETLNGLFEEADRTGAALRDPDLLNRQVRGISKRVVAGAKRRNKFDKNIKNDVKQLKAFLGRKRIPDEHKAAISEALGIIDEMDPMWGKVDEVFDLETHSTVIKESVAKLNQLVDDAQMPVGAKNRLKRIAEDATARLDADSSMIKYIREAHKNVPFRAIEAFNEATADAIHARILQSSKMTSSLADELMMQAEEAYALAKEFQETTDLMNTNQFKRLGPKQKELFDQIRFQLRNSYDETMGQIETGLEAAKIRARGLQAGKAREFERLMAAEVTREALRTGGNGDVATLAAMLSEGYSPKAIPAKHVALAKAWALNSLEENPGKMNVFAKELDKKLAAAGEDLSVTNNGRGWSTIEQEYFEWINDTFDVPNIKNSRVVYVQRPPGQATVENVTLIVDDGLRAVDPKYHLAMEGGEFEGMAAKDIAEFKKLKRQKQPIPEDLQKRVDSLDYGRAYAKHIKEYARLKEQGLAVPPELQRVVDNVTASVASDMRQYITDATVKAIQTGFLKAGGDFDMAAAAITRIADYFPDVYIKDGDLLMDAYKAARELNPEGLQKSIANIQKETEAAISEYRVKGNHKRRAFYKHLTREEKIAKGRIEDARFMFVRAYNEIMNDLVNLDMFNSIRDAKVQQGPFAGNKIMMTAEELAEAGLPRYDPPKKSTGFQTLDQMGVVFSKAEDGGKRGGAKYIKLPKDKRLGEFSDKYVPDDVYFEFKRLVDSPGQVAQAFNKTVQFFKWGNTAASVVTSLRNHGSNLAIADANNMLIGSGSATSRRLLADKKLWQQMWNRKGELFEEALLSGVLGNDFVSAELSGLRIGQTQVPNFMLSSLSDNPTLLAQVIADWELKQYGRIKGIPKRLAQIASHQYRFGDEFYKGLRYHQIRSLQDEFAKTKTLTREMEVALGGKAEALEVLNLDGKKAKMRAAAKKVHRDGFVDYGKKSLMVNWLSKGLKPFISFQGEIIPVMKRLLMKNPLKAQLYRMTVKQLEEYTTRVDAEKKGYDFEEVEVARSTLPFGVDVNGMFVGQREYTKPNGEKVPYFAFQDKQPLGAYGGPVGPSRGPFAENALGIPLEELVVPSVYDIPLIGDVVRVSNNRPRYSNTYGDLFPTHSEADFLTDKFPVAAEEIASGYLPKPFRDAVSLVRAAQGDPQRQSGTMQMMNFKDSVFANLIGEKPYQVQKGAWYRKIKREERRIKDNYSSQFGKIMGEDPTITPKAAGKKAAVDREKDRINMIKRAVQEREANEKKGRDAQARAKRKILLRDLFKD